MRGKSINFELNLERESEDPLNFVHLPAVVRVVFDDVNQSVITTANTNPSVSTPNNRPWKQDDNAEQYSDGLLDNLHFQA